MEAAISIGWSRVGPWIYPHCYVPVVVDVYIRIAPVDVAGIVAVALIDIAGIGVIALAVAIVDIPCSGTCTLPVTSIYITGSG